MGNSQSESNHSESASGLTRRSQEQSRTTSPKPGVVTIATGSTTASQSNSSAGSPYKSKTLAPEQSTDASPQAHNLSQYRRLSANNLDSNQRKSSTNSNTLPAHVSSVSTNVTPQNSPNLSLTRSSPSNTSASRKVNGSNQPKSTQSMAGSQPLTFFQKRQLKQTWPHVHRAASKGIGHLAYQRLIQQQPHIKEMFAKANAIRSFSASSAGSGGIQESHIKMLNELLDVGISNLENLDVFGDLCTEHGAVHAHMCQQGFSGELWDHMGQALLESITQLDPVRKHRELVRGWTVLISYMVDRLRQGYQEGVRKHYWARNQGSNPPSEVSSPTEAARDIGPNY